ncbi:amidohydrolase [Thermincola potens]|uniref:5-methylthioadenosine/S-adenosylhomocysteine deaminase n=1 Tax=Thermincola potens (strain JR) TaxID=635013 RepID=D5X8M5_THEPJ|nr:amidohydrolase [Thermincola potens]ADG82901.1 amidohydrolase [Thermincola potens JR]
MKKIIKNVDVLPMTEEGLVLRDAVVVIEGHTIKYVGAAEGLEAGWAAAEEIDGAGMLLLPGFINAHTHAAMTLLRSYADDLPLMQWLQERIWPLEEKLTAEDVYWGTKLCILEMIKSGTTTFADMYFFMEDVARAVEETGIRACLSRGMIGVAPTGPQALVESEALIEKWQEGAAGRITVMLGPHAPYTCPPDYLEKVMALAEKYKVGIHIHISETLQENNDIRKMYGKSPVAHLNDLGLFEYPVLAAHCVHVSPEDIKILQAKKVGVAHNPESNMKLASGIAPVPEMLAAGVAVGLGTDGAASNNNLDMLEEMRSAALLHKVNKMDPTTIPSYKALEMATTGSAQVVGLGDQVGKIAPGYKADMILINTEKAHLYPKHDYFAHMVYAAQSSDIDTVIINGSIVMRGREITCFDEKEVLRQAQRCAERLIG